MQSQQKKKEKNKLFTIEKVRVCEKEQFMWKTVYRTVSTHDIHWMKLLKCRRHVEPTHNFTNRILVTLSIHIICSF